jgi:hypothetical protein
VQQTVDAVAETKDQMIVDVDLETILVSGLSYFFYAVADAVLIAVDSDVAMTAAYGLSSCCSAVADAETASVDAASHQPKTERVLYDPLRFLSFSCSFLSVSLHIFFLSHSSSSTYTAFPSITNFSFISSLPHFSIPIIYDYFIFLYFGSYILSVL